jgi:hypothetical protein
MTFEMVTKEQTLDHCIAGAEDCVYIRFDFPVIVEAPAGAAVDAVTRRVHDFVLQPLEEQDATKPPEEPEERDEQEEPGEQEEQDAPTPSVTALMDQFISNFVSFKKEFPESAQVWYLERKALVHYNTRDVLSLSFTEQSYTGGAHDIETIHFVNLDPKSGATLSLADWVEPGSEQKLESIAESSFRAIRQIEEGESLTDAGFTFEDGKFTLTDNFAIGQDALTFYYNPYEIAPYAMGPTELVIPYKAIAALMRERNGGVTSGVKPLPPS